jgi:hypothetical protein
MKRVFLGLGILAAGIAAGGAVYLWGYTNGSATLTTAEQRALEVEFERSMSGVVLEGSFTMDGTETDALRTERYTVERVEKTAGDIWLFHARLQYGGTDVTLPVPVRIQWASDTPVVMLTDAALPGLGTFTARVVFYRDHYAGMWSSGTAGGHQFGRILRD